MWMGALNLKKNRKSLNKKKINNYNNISSYWLYRDSKFEFRIKINGGNNREKERKKEIRELSNANLNNYFYHRLLLNFLYCLLILYSKKYIGRI